MYLDILFGTLLILLIDSSIFKLEKSIFRMRDML